MATVETMRGPLDPADLGTTLMHEHVFVLSTELQQNYPSFDPETEIPRAVEKLQALKALGVDTIVDPTVQGLGRDIPQLQRVADQVDLNIIVATGIYTYGDLPHPFTYQGPDTMLGGDDPLVAMFIGDITEGIQGTGVKAAFLKCALEHLTPGTERAARAVARAAVATGRPITVHTNVHEGMGPEAQRIFREEGVDLTRVVVGHSGDSTDLDYLMRMADEGSILGMDRFGIDLLLPTPQRIDTVVALAERGYADRMVLSQDASCHIDWFPPGALAQAAPNWTYTHIHEQVLPALTERGVSDAQIHQMLVEVPRRYFEESAA